MCGFSCQPEQKSELRLIPTPAACGSDLLNFNASFFYFFLLKASSRGETDRKLALLLVVVHTGTHQLKIIWNLIQENSEDNYEFSSAEKRVLNTNRHWTV